MTAQTHGRQATGPRPVSKNRMRMLERLSADAERASVAAMQCYELELDAEKADVFLNMAVRYTRTVKFARSAIAAIRNRQKKGR